jgi:uncharacterized protein YciI
MKTAGQLEKRVYFYTKSKNMKGTLKTCLFGAVLAIVAACSGEKTEQAEEVPVADSIVPVVDPYAYDSTYAAALGADEYGMKAYVMAFLKAGPNRDMDSAQAAELQRGHMDNINRMAEEGKLVLAGPFLHDGDLRGIYVFNVATVEEAEALTNTDPAIQAGSLVMELIPWYGSAALMDVNNLHKKASKIQI